MTGLIASFRKNANEEVRVSLDDFSGHLLVNVRVWYSTANGEMRPGKQGIAVRVEQLPDLTAALAKAAKELTP
ncbi:MAG: transcriptional coactivator p15/PC4 family protein [Amaricoccus sp.]